MYLEELLPEFRKGVKIRRKSWKKNWFIRISNGGIYTQEDELHDFFLGDFIQDCWELYEEPIDWDYIIKNKCLCWFWNKGYEFRKAIFLRCKEKDYFLDDRGIYWDYCRPVRRDEVTFYEDRKDE